MSQDKERFTVPRSTQQMIPIDRIWPDGIFQIGSKFSKSWKITDINYAVASEEDQVDMFMGYSALLNSLDASATAKITICNRRLNIADFRSSILIPDKQDGLNRFRKEYNDMLLAKAVSSNNNMVKDKYITITVSRKTVEDSRVFFSRVGSELQHHLARISSSLIELDAAERLRILHDYFRVGEEVFYQFNYRDTMRRGHNFKDYVCPDSFEVNKDHIVIGNRYSRSIFLREYGTYIKDDMITEMSELAQNLVLSIDILPVPTDEAVKLVQNKLLITNWQQREGMNTSLPYGLNSIFAKRTMTTESTAVLMPFKTQELMEPGGSYYGQNSKSRNMIIVNRRKLLNGNGFILGVSGSGKSFAAKREICDIALSTDDDILIVDPEREYAPLIKGLGGEVIQIAAGSKNCINAMDINANYGGDVGNPIYLKSEFILSLCEQLIGAGKLSAKEKSIIDRCTSNVYRNYIRRGYKTKPPTLEQFHEELMKQEDPEAREVALAIELFTKGSLNAFAKQTNVDIDNRFIVYDIKDLGRQLKTIGMLVVLDAIFNRITKNRNEGRNTWIVIDEIYVLFANEYSANFLFEMWKRVRKYGAFCTGITQNVEDLLQSHTARTMLSNSEFLMMLNQAGSDRLELARLLNISDSQLSQVDNAEAGKGLLKCSGNIVPFQDNFPKDTELYSLLTTKFEERNGWVKV
jgi:hypothetical protein